MARQTFRLAQPQGADVDILQPGQSPLALHVRTWLTASPLIALDTGGAQMCVMFLHDLREMEARLRTEKLAAMGRMSAAVAHEIRNPLAAIVQANALLEEDLSDPAHRRLAHMVQQNADRLARIAEEVLDIARVQHQIDHAPAGTLPLDDSVAQVCRDWLSHHPHSRRAQLSLHAAGTQVEFDADHLRRVLVNLLDNALRYMGAEPDSLCISTYTNAGGQAHLQVWSDGAPLDKTVERHLFEPFFRPRAAPAAWASTSAANSASAMAPPSATSGSRGCWSAAPSAATHSRWPSAAPPGRAGRRPRCLTQSSSDTACPLRHECPRRHHPGRR